MGGEAALDLTLAAPERVRALVAVVATPSGWEHTADHMAQFEVVEDAYERDGLDAANEVELRMGRRRRPRGRGRGSRRPSGRRAHEPRRPSARGARERAGIDVEPAELAPPAVGRLGEVSAPTLVVTGELDQPSVIAGARAMAAGIPGAEIAEIADTAHVPFMEHPGEFDAVVLPFLWRDPGVAGLETCAPSMSTW